MPLPDRYRRYIPYLPAIVAAVLALPVLGFTFFWDDYSFLTNAVFYQLHDWAPDPADPFYRPISRGVYFTLLSLAGRDGALLGHVLNLTFLIAIVLLLGSLATRLAGRRVGVLASLMYAGLAAASACVAWVCCDQDLLAILFVLIALHLRLSRRNVAAFFAMCGALLSKETTLAVIPVIVLLDWILDRRPYRIGRHAAAYGGMIAAWTTVHPAIRVLLSRGLRSGATGYVGLDHPERWAVYVARYVLTLFNIPAFPHLPDWPTYGVLLVLGAGAVGWLVIRELNRAPDSPESQPVTSGRVLLLGTLLAAGPLLLTSTMVRVWSPYYAAFPALGFSLIGATLLRHVTERAQIVFLVVFLILGMWSRGHTDDPEEATEGNWKVTSGALQQVEKGFRRVYPSFQPDTHVLLSVQARGSAGIYTHMYSLQVLRLWYGDRSLHILRPEGRTPTNGPEVLAVIGPDRDVLDINPSTMYARAASGRNPDYDICETAVRAYAMGLAGSGETDAAATVLLRMPEVSPGLRSVHRRMAAMFLLAGNRPQDAKAVLDSTVTLPTSIAIADLHAVLAEQPPGTIYDDVALAAFGIDQRDSTSMLQLMQWFANNKYAEVAIRFAKRVQDLRPDDPRAAAVIAEMTAILDKRRREPPGPASVE